MTLTFETDKDGIKDEPAYQISRSTLLNSKGIARIHSHLHIHAHTQWSECSTWTAEMVRKYGTLAQRCWC